MKKILFLISFCLLLFVSNISAQGDTTFWKSRYDSTWWSDTEYGLNYWFDLDSGSTKLPIGAAATDTVEFLPTIIYYDSLANPKEGSWIADDGTITLPTSTSGWGRVQIGDAQEWAYFNWKVAGTVALESNSANVVNTDTDTNLCIISGNPVVIKNRLGSALTIKIDVKY